MKPYSLFSISLTAAWRITRRNIVLSCIILVCTTAVRAQEVRPQNLVFEGSGIRGIAFAGAIATLEEKNMLQGIKRVGGTSAGAVTALLLSLGYSSEEITRIVRSTPYKKFNDGRFFFIGGINRLNKYFGWYRGRQFEKWLDELIIRKTNNADIRFADLKRQGFKELYVTGTSLNKQRLVIFSHESYPHMKVKDAVRISMSIPLYFEAVHLDASGNIVNHPKNREGLDIMIDGGLTGNFPIKIFDSTKYFRTSEANRYAVNPHTIGFRIDRDEQIQKDERAAGLADMPGSNIKEYFSAFYTLVMENLNRQSLTPDDWQRTVSISDATVAPRIRKLSDTEIDMLVRSGSTATSVYLSRKSW